MTCRDRALQLEPDNPLLWWSMAEAYCVLDRRAEAVEGVRKVGAKLKKLVAETQQREATAAEQVDKASKMSGGAMNTTSSLKAKIDELEKTVLSSRALFSFTASLIYSFTPSLFLVSSICRLHSLPRSITIHSSLLHSFTPSLSLSLSFSSLSLYIYI